MSNLHNIIALIRSQVIERYQLSGYFYIHFYLVDIYEEVLN